RKDVTLRKLDIKVETVNREPLTLHADREEDTASVSTATRVMKAIYSSFKDDVDLKQDLRCDTIDTREEYELKVRPHAPLNPNPALPTHQHSPKPTDLPIFPFQDPTNGYYNVRAHEERPASRSVLYGDYRAPGPGGPRFEPRPPSRLSHSSGYAQLSSYPRGGPEFPAEAAAAPPGTAVPAGDTSSQLSYENYAGVGVGVGFPGPTAAFPPYRLGFGGAYEPYEAVGKFGGGATRFSYTSQHSDYGQRFQQRMQTHV
ncbi:hypothetical protein EK904_005612, partial [Melospiza melodia maxima]